MYSYCRGLLCFCSAQLCTCILIPASFSLPSCFNLFFQPVVGVRGLFYLYIYISLCFYEGARLFSLAVFILTPSGQEQAPKKRRQVQGWTERVVRFM